MSATKTVTRYTVPTVGTIAEIRGLIRWRFELQLANSTRLKKWWTLRLVDKFVARTFSPTTPPENRTTTMLLIGIGQIYGRTHVRPVAWTIEQLRVQLDELLYGGGQPLKPLD